MYDKPGAADEALLCSLEVVSCQQSRQPTPDRPLFQSSFANKTGVTFDLRRPKCLDYNL